MDTNKDIVSIIIVGWNHWFVLKNCIDSIYKQDYKNIEIIFVDNASIDNSVENTKIGFPNVKVISNSENHGFSKGNNIGISIASGQYIMVLNPDTILTKDCITEFIKASRIDDKIGICAPKLLLFNNEKIINSVGMRFNRYGRNYHIGDGEIDNGQYSEIKEVPMVAGACMFCNKKMLDEIGGFDEDFFAYGEDCELSLHAWWLGWKCMYIPTAIVYHMRNAAARKYSKYYEIARYYAHRNRYWNIFIYMPARHIVKVLPAICYKELFVIIKGLLRWVKYRRIPVEIQARLGAIKMMNRLISKRKRMKHQCKISTELMDILLQQDYKKV